MKKQLERIIEVIGKVLSTALLILWLILTILSIIEYGNYLPEYHGNNANNITVIR